MAFKRGVYIQESPTPLTPPVQVDSAMPIAFGAAPVHRLEKPAESVNCPIILYSYGEGVERFSYSDNWGDFTLSEMLYSQFRLHNIAPLIMVNVWDPTESMEDAAVVELPLINGVGVIDDGMAMISTVQVIDPSNGGTIYERGKDYTLTYKGEQLLITKINGGDIHQSVDVNYKRAIVSVTPQHIIGGIDETTQKRMGIELADEVFLRFQKNPGFLLAPGWSQEPEVAAMLTAKAKSLNNNNFSCVALLDFPANSELKRYSDVPVWKLKNGYNDPHAFGDWPCVAIGDKVFHPSTRLAGMFGAIDAENGGSPHVSASNKPLAMTKTCLRDGTELPMLDIGQANLLNENGIGTFLNWGGWRTWGGETTAYPSNTDVKDCERSIRRTFCWIQNTVNRTIFQRVDGPITYILIDGIKLTLNQWFNTLTAEGAILGGRVEFLKADNEKMGLMSGRLYFRVYICPPNAAKDITFDFQYDPDYLDVLFEG